MKRPLCIPAVMMCVMTVSIAVADAGDVNTRVSVDSAGVQGNAPSNTPAISSDGRFVAFVSHADNLVPGDTNHVDDIFVHDRLTGATTRVSVDSSGNEAQGNCMQPSISADGRYVAFVSLDMGEGGFPQAWVHDSETRTTTCVSLNSRGLPGAGNCFSTAITPDGRYVAFASSAKDLGPGTDYFSAFDVFVYDQETGELTIASVDSSGQRHDDDSWNPSMSNDGRYVAFESFAHYDPTDTNYWDIIVHDQVTGETSYVSLNSQGERGNHNSVNASISADGRYVAFESVATNLVPGDTNGWSDVFRRDRATGQTIRVSVDSFGNQSNSRSESPSLSADGRYVTFRSFATNLVPGDANVGDVFVHDCLTGLTTRASLSAGGGDADGISNHPRISGDARFVAFESLADNLVSDDTNHLQDVFLRGRELTLEAEPLVISTGQTLTFTSYFGVPGNGASLWAVAVSGTPVFQLLLVGSFAPNGLFTVAGTVPPGFASGDVSFRSYCIGMSGNVVATNDIVVEFQ